MHSSVNTPSDLPVLRELNRQRSFATLRSVMALMLREMSTTYGRSPIGYLWAILQPTAGIILLTLVFSVMLRSPPLGKSFALFYATGLIPFLFYTDISSKLATSIQFSKLLLVYPSVTVVDALLARLTLNGLTQLLVAFLLFAALLMFDDAQVDLDLPAITLAFAMTLALSVGIGVMNTFLFGIFDDWIRIWAVLNRPMFILSCLLFLYEDVPEPYRSYLWYNPLVHIVGQMRNGFYPYYSASYVSPTYVFALSLILTLLGLIFLLRFALHILNR